ncbi:MAG: lipoyl synthase [Candidatus Gastranaerophilales bacterium]|nr:lipoyl synthase [Candidatus Gastranaerophilales bacterium]
MNKRLPEWIKRGIINTETTKNVRNILNKHNLNTVCEGARCPNKNECYSNNTATFLIMGNNCTRNCRFCCINSAVPDPLEPDEPSHIADAVKKLNLKYVVITSVTRDDLDDGGANHFAKTIKAVKGLNPDIKVEVLTPDFKGNKESILTVIDAKPDVFNHNIETVSKLYSKVRPQAEYLRSLELLRQVKEYNPHILIKSGIMVGLGETLPDLIETLNDLKNYNCDIVTIGQYIQPTKLHIEVNRYLKPEEFENLKRIGKEIGLRHVEAAPLVRSSYNAGHVIESLLNITNPSII